MTRWWVSRMQRGEHSSALINKCSDVAQTVMRGRRHEECLCVDNVQKTENKPTGPTIIFRLHAAEKHQRSCSGRRLKSLWRKLYKHTQQYESVIILQQTNVKSEQAENLKRAWERANSDRKRKWHIRCSAALQSQRNAAWWRPALMWIPKKPHRASSNTGDHRLTWPERRASDSHMIMCITYI